MTWKQDFNQWETVEFCLPGLSLSSELQQDPLVKTRPAPVSLKFFFFFFLSGYNDRVAWVCIFVFLGDQATSANPVGFQRNEPHWSVHWFVLRVCNKIEWGVLTPKKCVLLQQSGPLAVKCCVWTTRSLSYPHKKLHSSEIYCVKHNEGLMKRSAALTCTKSANLKQAAFMHLRSKPTFHKSRTTSKYTCAQRILWVTDLHFIMLSVHLYAPKSTAEKMQEMEAAAPAAKVLASQQHR